jgi:predicted O-methyltransferase YrrM
MSDVPYRRSFNGEEFFQECFIPLDFELISNNPVELIATERNDEERRFASISEHVTTLFFIVSEFNIKKILELGVGHGNSTIAFLKGLEKTDGRLISVDYDECDYAKSRILKYGLEKRWKFLHNNDMEIEWNEEVDLLFIDSSHEYKHTKAEINKYEKFVRIGGFLIFHDTFMFPGVELAVDEFMNEHPQCVRYRWFNNCGLQVIKKC